MLSFGGYQEPTLSSYPPSIHKTNQKKETKKRKKKRKKKKARNIKGQNEN